MRRAQAGCRRTEQVQFRTRSILQLTIIGFLIVGALLVAALLMSARQLELITDLSQRTANQSATAMRAGRQLVEHTSAMERNARQYAVTGDPALREFYEARRHDFHQSLAMLYSLDLNDSIRLQMQNLLDSDAEAHQHILELNTVPQADFNYPILLEAAHMLARTLSTWVDDQVAQVRERTFYAQRTLNLQTLFLVMAALGMAGWFIRLITQPLGQIDKAIYKLGGGAYQDPIQIRGPKDLQVLGERLDWLRTRLAQLEQQRSSFLRHVSHELKTPLAAIQESAALLNDGIVGELSDDQKRIIRILSNNCSRLLELIENLLRYNAGRFSVLEAMPRPVNLVKLTKAVIATYDSAMNSNGIRVELEAGRLVVSGDEERLRVIVDNLLSNAVKYSPQDGIISIRLYEEEPQGDQDGRFGIFEIQDQGPGIAVNESKSIFTAFYQGKAPERGYYKGSGLGLAIAREYAIAGGGSIELVAANKGAYFRARFPLTGTERAVTHR
jgi:two-component system, NtrC family, sensor histidine kinase GlrK